MLELLFAWVGAVIAWIVGIAEFVIGLLLALFGRPRIHRPRAVPQASEPRALPPEATAAIVAALQGERDASPALPPGWRGSYSGVAEEDAINADGRARADIIARLANGATAQLIPEPENPEREDAVRIMVELPDGSTVQIGFLPGAHELSRSIALGWVRCWFANRKRTLRNPDAASIFLAVYDP